MIERRTAWNIIPHQQGFTLVEVLVAVIVLLVGVVVALRIFPRGFDVFTRTQQAASATQQNQGMLTALLDHPENLPDSIEPVDTSTLPASPYFTWDNLADITVNGFQFQSYGFGGNGQWLLGEPMSLRVLRHVVGERCVIPSPLSANGSLGVSTYCVRYGPIENDAPNPANPSLPKNLLSIYDLRYRRMNQNAFGTIANSPDQLYYDIDYGGSDGNAPTLYFPPSASGQSVRVIFEYEDPKTTTITRFTSPTPLSISSGSIQLSSSVPSGDYIVPGSEQLYRAYTVNVLTAPATLPTSIPSGQCYIQITNPTSSPIGIIYFAAADAGRTVKIDYTVLDWEILHDDVTVDGSGALELGLLPKLANQPNPPREATTWALYEPMKSGSIVMDLVNSQTGLDYPVTVNDPTLTTLAATPTSTTGRKYSFTMNSTQYYLIQDPHNSKRFYICLAMDNPLGGSGNPIFGQTLAGQTFRVYYRAVHDWARQVFRAPANFQQFNAPAANLTVMQLQTLQWSQFCWAPAIAGTAFSSAPPSSGPGTTLTFTTTGTPSELAGNNLAFATLPTGIGVGMSATVAGDATSYTVMAINPSANTITVSPAPLASDTGVWTFGMPLGVSVGMQCCLAGNPIIYTVTSVTASTVTVTPAVTGAVTGFWIFYGKAWISVLGFLSGQTLAVDYTYAGNPANNEPLLVHVSGEMHTVPSPAAGQTLAQPISQLLLAHCPVPGTTVSVHGLSVTVRSLWTQARSGPSLMLQDTGAPIAGTITDSWLSRQATGVLPANTE